MVCLFTYGRQGFDVFSGLYLLRMLANNLQNKNIKEVDFNENNPLYENNYKIP